MNFPNHSTQGVTVGSIEGDGSVFLGEKNLTVGGSNLSTTFSGVMRDGGQNGGTGGSLTKIGTGTLDLTGANTYTGTTKVNNGLLRVDGSITSNTIVNHGTLAGTGTVHGNVTNNSRVSPGDNAPGTLTVDSYTQAGNGGLLIDILGPNTSQFSVLDVLGNANLNGVLHPVLLNGFIPTVGESFTFLNYAALTGAFSRIGNQNFDNGMERWSVTYQNTGATLTVIKSVPDQASTLLLLTLGLLGLSGCRAPVEETGLNVALRAAVQIPDR
jgi:autotransporter-associated beta strand protein